MSTQREPTPIRWTCPCGKELGTISKGGNLHVTADNVLVERTRLTVIVRCSCGQSKAFNGRRVSIDLPETRAA